MIIETSELHGKHRDTILAHMLLEAPSPIINNVLKTLEHLHGDDRIISVKVLFNDVEYDGQILEDLLQKQWKYNLTKLENNYSDLEKLAIKKAEKLFKARLSDLKEPTLKRLAVVQEKLSQIQLELDCL